MGEGQSLLDWAGKQPEWARDALHRHAGSPRFELSEVDKAAVLDRVRHAAGIEPETKPDHLPLEMEHLDVGHATRPRSLLCSLGPVVNLGRLALGQQLRFALDGITLIYGDNGSGKSGYCRITKKLCRSLTSEDLLGNVFEPGDKPPAEVLVRYLPDGATEIVEELWMDGTAPPEAVRSISVFDSRNARLYVDKQNRIGFLPAVISLLERHGTHRSEMDAVFQAEKKSLETQFKIPLPGGYTTNGKIANIIAKLQPKAKELPTEADIKKFSAWSAKDQEELVELEKSLAQDPAALATRCERAAAVLSVYVNVLNNIEAGLSDTVAHELETITIAATTTAQAAALAADDAFVGEPLPEVGKEPWRLMYDHAKAYIAAIGGDGVPSAEGELCALCQQPLSAEASHRMNRFREFVAGETAKMAAVTKTALNQALIDLNTVAVPAKIEIELALAEYRGISVGRAALGSNLAAYVDAALSRKSSLVEAVGGGSFAEVVVLPEPITASVTAEVEALWNEANAYHGQAKLDTKRAEEVERLNELKDREKLSNSLPTVLARRAELERHTKVLECAKLVGTQQLSTLITTIRRTLVTDGLEQRIKAEIDGLDLGHVPFAVSDQSRDGHSYFEVSLKAPAVVPNEKVLSEGEQRALALACFFAEVGADIANNGLVIDDPVSSLDHLRIRRVAERLVTEAAKGKQVILFTHNLLFYNEVLQAAAAASPPVPVARRVVTKSNAKGFGLISETEEPWTAQKVKERIVRLQTRRKQLEAFTDLDTDEYRRAAKDFYSDLRETWERLIEELLLGRVVERYNSDVKTQSLKGVTVDNEDYKTVFWAMKRVSERSGHDMAASKQIPTPTPTDMKADLDTIDTYRAKIDKRRKELSKERETLEDPPAAKVV